MIQQTAAVLPMRVVSQHGFANVVLNETTGQQAFYATKNFVVGEIIARFSAGETLSHPNYLTVQVDVDKHITLQPMHLQYINHSCAPNLFFDTSNLHIVCIKEIAEGDEMTFFYPSTEWDMDQPFDCHCGELNCLGNIKGAAYMSLQQLKQYKLNNFIKQQIRLIAQ
jgi:hypothetical protein